MAKGIATQRSPLFSFTGIACLLLLAAGLFLFLFVGNVRSRIYYHGPDYSFLFWMFLYCAITAFGLLGRRKWAVIALFVPGILVAVILVFAVLKEPDPSYEVFFWVGFLAIIIGIPATMLRDWRELRW